MFQKVLNYKYRIILVAFAIWMLFFDTNSIITHIQLSKELRDLEDEKNLIKEAIKKEKVEYERLKNHPSDVEKLAREKFFLKKENEDIFVIEIQKEKSK